MLVSISTRAGRRRLLAWTRLASALSSSLGDECRSANSQLLVSWGCHQPAWTSSWAAWPSSIFRLPPLSPARGSWAAASFHSCPHPPPQQQWRRWYSTEDGKQQQWQQQGYGAAAAAGSSVAPPANPAAGTWVTCLPRAWQPYALLMRLDKPIGTWLLAWPCFWSIAMAAPPGSLPDAQLLGLFGAGALLLRGAGCTINDLWDRELDRRVERTRTRPLAAGTITPAAAVGEQGRLPQVRLAHATSLAADCLRQARKAKLSLIQIIPPPASAAFLGAQLSLGLGILLQLNGYSQALGASSLALVATYPAMKRITGWPQVGVGAARWQRARWWKRLCAGAAVPGSATPPCPCPHRPRRPTSA